MNIFIYMIFLIRIELASQTISLSDSLERFLIQNISMKTWKDTS